MRRLKFSLIVAAAVLAFPTAALATQLPPRSVQVTGLLTSAGTYSFTIQTPGRPTGVLNAMARAATRITAQDYPYVWGGGHGQAGIASVGERGPGFNGRRRGYDCSGAVAAVLVAGGLWPAGAGVPNDAGVIRYLRQRHEILPGAGNGPREVTLYDRPGVHIFMNIDGRFFGTSDGGGGGDRRGGPGWLDDGAWDAHSRAFRRYHFVPGLLGAKTNAGYTLAFQFGPGVSVDGLPAGTRVRVVYKTTNQGTMVAQSVTPLGEVTATGVIQAIATDGSSFTITTPTGQSLSFPALAGGPLAQALLDGQLVVGDTISLTYISRPALTVLSVTVVTAVPAPTTTTPTPTPTTTTPPPTTTTPPPTTTTPTTTTPTTTTPAPNTPTSGGIGVSAGWS